MLLFCVGVEREKYDYGMLLGYRERYDYDVDGVERERYEVVVVYKFYDKHTHNTLSLYSIHIIIIPLSVPQQHTIIILLSLYSNTKQQHTIFQLKTTCSIVYLIKLSSFST
jgi:hypothetical protein